MSETISCDIDVSCSACGTDLKTSFRNGILKVDLCKICELEIRDKEYAKGYSDKESEEK